MWPPVPPPAISRRIGPPVGWLARGLVARGRGEIALDRLAGDRQEHPDRREAHDERGPTGTDERQRDPGDGQEVDDDPDVDERLTAQPDRDPGCEQRAEGVRGAAG